ncbi:two component regulator with propeller domain [Kordia periserrulae]|uniref:Two component regulator with propeller domain n=1 Tax=Kordia periserrulae TaxID=701523 RepID=A0A2T6C245_9FLAO|nr:LytTR family transcriptional regulator DNA-binding domain-containing protein [Kordia periserrulae]PTX62363.1 two component regulator with propeller domain [Kordia periserrulae]
MKTNLALCFFLCFCSFLFSQQYIYEEFGINDGLPSLEVHGMHQDKSGFIWFATDRGLVYTNGYEMKRFDFENSISNAVVLDLFPQSNGTIYAATFNNQLFYFDEVFRGFVAYKYNDILREKLEFKQHIMNVYIDAEENVHIACEYMYGKLIISKEGEILKQPSKKWEPGLPTIWMKLEKIDDQTLFFSFDNDSIVSNNNTIRSKIEHAQDKEVIVLNDANYIVYNDGNNLAILDANGKEINRIATETLPIVLKALSPTTFFVGFEFGGGVIMDINGNSKAHFLPNESVTDFLIDHEGGYWFSTLYSGVFYVKEPHIKLFETGLKSPVMSLTKTNKDELYIGYRTGDVLKLDQHRKLFREASSEIETEALVMYDTVSELLYVKLDDNFYTKNIHDQKTYFPDSISRSYFIKLSEPTHHKIIASNQTGFVVVDSMSIKKNIMPQRVHDVAFLDDTYYIGTPLGAFTMQNGQTTALSVHHPIFTYRIEDIDINEARQEVYFATLGKGIIIYHPTTGNVKNIDASQGLSSNIVNELKIVNNNELWVCTNHGVDKITFKADGSLHISGLKSSKGLLNDGINDVEITNDTVWIASIKGLTYVSKSFFETSKIAPPNFLQVNASYVNDSIYEFSNLTKLSHKENRIDFWVEAISFKNTKDIVYTYQMEGLDTKLYTTKNRKISYSALPYGNYTFKVAATTSDKEAFNFIEIPVHIHAPFWKQTWFVISVILTVIALIYLFFKYRILSYNQHIIGELLRLLMKKIKRKERYFSFKEAGKEIRIKTDTILYVKSAGNYVEVVTEQKNYTIRTKIGEFINLMPDSLEYLRIHRSYIVRIDKVEEKNTKEVTVQGHKIPVSNSYVDELQKLIF